MCWLGATADASFCGRDGWFGLGFGAGTLVAIGVLAVGALLFTLNDFFDPDPFWSGGYSGVRLVGSWMIVASMVVVLAGVLWSAEQHLTDVAATAAWWRRQWVIGVGGVAVLSIIGVGGFIFFGDEDPLGPATDAEDEGGGPVQDEWSLAVSVDDAGGTMHNVHMIKTFSPLEEPDVQDVGGRLSGRRPRSSCAALKSNRSATDSFRSATSSRQRGMRTRDAPGLRGLRIARNRVLVRAVRRHRRRILRATRRRLTRPPTEDFAGSGDDDRTDHPIGAGRGHSYRAC